MKIWIEKKIGFVTSYVTEDPKLKNAVSVEVKEIPENIFHWYYDGENLTKRTEEFERSKQKSFEELTTEEIKMTQDTLIELIDEIMGGKL